MKEIQFQVTKLGHRVFRNNVGFAKTKNGCPIKFGLCVGSSDLIGWTTIEITDKMVGKKIAVFTALEIKIENGIIKAEQQNFINEVNRAGGIGRVLRSVTDLYEELHNLWK